MEENKINNREIETISSSIIKEEMNLVEFPFTLLSYRAFKDQKTFEVSQKVRSHNARFITQR